MDMRVDDRRHDGLAIEAHTRGPVGHSDSGARPHDPGAVDHERRILDNASITDDEAATFERGDLSVHRTGKSGKKSKSGRGSGCIHWTHLILRR